MFISTIFLIISFVPLILLYENRKPQAREIVIISVMSAFTVIANLICAYTIPFHAGTAMVILTGIALGARAGFATGALSRFICNFFMTQGTWTVWEMLAWGLLGALAGVLFSKVEMLGILDNKNEYRKKAKKTGIQICMIPLLCIFVCEIIGYVLYLLGSNASESFWGWRIYVFGLIGMLVSFLFRKNKLPVNFITMTVFTFLSVFILYGGIMNFAAFTMTQSSYNDSVGALKMLYITGLPYDIGHALGAAICVFFIGESIVRKIERVRIKYGIIKRK